jgi:hypothetical protein
LRGPERIPNIGDNPAGFFVPDIPVFDFFIGSLDIEECRQGQGNNHGKKGDDDQ